MPSARGIVVFSGGSAANALVDVFESIRKSQSKSNSLQSESHTSPTSQGSCPLSYIIPISDNGGSSSELIRVFGGPGIGDVRSRLVRLIPREPYSKEREAIRELLSWRLSTSDGKAAREGWNDIVDGTSHLWKGISSAKKELIRSFFNLVNLEIIKRSRPPSSTFDFRAASVGNLFLTGARLFSGSFESAIYLMSVVCGIPSSVADENEGVKVIPSVNSNFSHHIAAELEDGKGIVVGQNAISHPSIECQQQQQQQNGNRKDSRHIWSGVVAGEARVPHGAVGDITDATAEAEDIPSESTAINVNGKGSLRSNSVGHWLDTEDTELLQEEEDAHPPFTLPTLRTKNITYSKSAHELSELPARIQRIYYINSFGQEILPPANPRMLSAINSAKAIIYSIGSLYTSLVPNLILRGAGESLRKSNAKVKILILNGSLDREVGPARLDRPFTAVDFVDAIVRAGEQSRGVVWATTTPNRDGSELDGNTFEGRDIRQDNDDGVRGRPTETLSTMMITNKLFPPPLLASTMNSRAPSLSPSSSPTRRTNYSSSSNIRVPSSSATSSRSSSKPDPIYKHYVTHLLHLPNTEETPHVDKEELAARGIKAVEVSGKSNDGGGDGMLYDFEDLKCAIETILANQESQRRPEVRIAEIQTERGRPNILPVR